MESDDLAHWFTVTVESGDLAHWFTVTVDSGGEW